MPEETMPKKHPLLLPEDSTPDEEALETMRDRGGRWAAYQNVDLGHPQIGHLRFLQFGGPESTFKVPPERHPDTPQVIGWRYYYVGEVNLTTGKIE